MQEFLRFFRVVGSEEEDPQVQLLSFQNNKGLNPCCMANAALAQAEGLSAQGAQIDGQLQQGAAQVLANPKPINAAGPEVGALANAIVACCRTNPVPQSAPALLPATAAAITLAQRIVNAGGESDTHIPQSF